MDAPVDTLIEQETAPEAETQQQTVDSTPQEEGTEAVVPAPDAETTLQNEATPEQNGQQQNGQTPIQPPAQQIYYDSREEVGKRFRERAKPLVEQTRDLWQRIQRIEDPVTRTLKELAYMQLFRPMWEDSINEQYYIDYPHRRPDPEVENRKVQERLANVPQVILQAAYDMVQGQPWYGARQPQNRQMPVLPENLQQNGNMPVVPQNWQVPAAQGSQQMPVPSQAETGGRFRAFTAPPAGQTVTAVIPTLTSDPTSDATSEVPLVAYSATSRKKRKLAEKKAAKLAELANQQGNDILPADTVSQQGEEAGVDRREEELKQSRVILNCMQQVKETGKCPEKLVMTAGTAFIEDMDREAEKIEKQISQLTQMINEIDDEAFAALEEYGPQHPLVLESNRLVAIRYNLDNKLKWPELIKHTLSKYREIGYSTQMTSGTYAGELFVNCCVADSDKMEEEACKKWVAEACDYFPTDWLNYGTDAGKMLVGRADRAYYNHYGDGQHSVLYLDSEQDDKATSFHEIVHRFEQVVPDLLAAEQAYYLSRTAGEAVVALKEYDDRYRSDEYTRPDHFAHPYMGKDYAGFSSNAGTNRPSYELCSMGFQYLFTDISKFNGDTHMIQWLFGLLLLI